MFGGFVRVDGDWAARSRQVQKLNLGTALIPDYNPPIWDDSLQVRSASLVRVAHAAYIAHACLTSRFVQNIKSI